MKKRAFTLIELMVVLAIIALLSALIFGAIGSVREGNKRGSCQGNLNQIYAAARLYAQDNDGQFPYLNPNKADDSGNLPANQAPLGGAGLWSLYVYAPTRASGDMYGLPLSNSDSSPGTSRPPATLASYLKSPRAFHCPSDNFSREVQYNDGTKTLATQIVSDEQLEFTGDNDKRLHLNPNYLSYQLSFSPATLPGSVPKSLQFDDSPGGATPTYSSFRLSEATRQMRYFKQDTPGPNGKVTLGDRRAPDQTVVTWCRWHRPLNSGGANEGMTKSGIDYSRTLDNVLFLDGSVQSVPVSQAVTSINGTTATCQGWQRVPLAEAGAVPNNLTDSSKADHCVS